MTPTLTALDAERAVLGAMLLDPECVPGVLARMSPDAFAGQRHARIFSAVSDLNNRGCSSDLVSLTETLKVQSSLDSVGGASYLAELLGCVVTSAHVENHTGLILEAWQKRRLKAIAAETVRNVESGMSAGDAIAEVQNAVFKVAQEQSDTGYASVAQTLGPVVANLEAAQKSGTFTTGVRTGISKLDSMLLGLQPGNLYVLAARPSMGKSALALNIATHVTKQGIGTSLFSLEMGRELLVQRMLSTEANVNSHRMQAGSLIPPEWGRVSYAAGILSELPLYIDDTPALTCSGLASRARLMATQHDVGFIVVDYLQLIRGSIRSQGRSKNDEVGEIMAGLQALARQLRVPILLLSQLSRGLEYRSDKRPLLSDLRDSGNIEQDAYVCMFIYREGQYETDGDSTGGLTELIVRKNRGGPCGMVRLKFNAPTTSFTDWEEGF